MTAFFVLDTSRPRSTAVAEWPIVAPGVIVLRPPERPAGFLALPGADAYLEDQAHRAMSVLVNRGVRPEVD